VNRRLRAIALALITLLAFALRVARTNEPFSSNDNCQLAYLCAHSWGYTWTLTSHYGPLQALIVRLFARAVTALNHPMNEMLWRLPLIIISSITPLLSFALVRRLARSDAAAFAAALWIAILPPLVSDARYLWAYETLGVALAALTLLAALRYLDRPTTPRAVALGATLALYLLSHLLTYALPLVLIITLFTLAAPVRWPKLALRPAILLPPLLAIALLIASHLALGEGPIGRLRFKFAITTQPAHDLSNVALLLRTWFGHLGYVATALALLAFLIAAPSALRLRSPIAPLWWWPILFVIPLIAPAFSKTLPAGTRYTVYFVQASYAATLLTAAVLIPIAQRRAGQIGASALAALIALPALASTLDNHFADRRYARLTGIDVNYGRAPDNPGYKSAAWYVRTVAPPDAVIATPHDYYGLEWLNAGYYFGRDCLAWSDLTPQQSAALVAGFLDRIDVLVLERRLNLPAPADPDFELVATIRRDGNPVIEIYARRNLNLPHETLDVDATDPRFDHDFGLRQLAQPIAHPPRLPRYREIESAAARIRTATPDIAPRQSPPHPPITTTSSKVVPALPPRYHQ